MKILILNGPNLNLLGKREPQIYGNITLDDLKEALEKHALKLGCNIDFFQSNHEGELIDKIQEADEKYSGIIFNPGGLTHYSISLRDAILAIKTPVIEVHISNIFAREKFRRKSVISPVVAGVISGLGIAGYNLALDYLVQYKKKS